jgi:D-alanyl-lipoteichoic acid acyltransferase DltB (MBOAT superfamily)
MSLSQFLRDYLYIPLGGNRKGQARRYVNLMVTMLLGGLWHGAGWTFVIWGGLHGLYLVANHLLRTARPPLEYRICSGRPQLDEVLAIADLRHCPTMQTYPSRFTPVTMFVETTGKILLASSFHSCSVRMFCPRSRDMK